MLLSFDTTNTFFIVIHCPALLDVENATRTSNDTWYNSTVTINCDEGYQFPDKIRTKDIVCTVNETWTDYPPPCEGKRYSQKNFTKSLRTRTILP